MASEVSNIRTSEQQEPGSNTKHYDLGTLRLCQAKALIEALGIASEHAENGFPGTDAAFGIVTLLDQAGEAFEKHHEAHR